MEELDIEHLLQTFNDRGFEKGEKVILGHFGTVQTLLSLILDIPIRVQLIDQKTRGGHIVRIVHLMAGEIFTCHAVSHIPVDQNLEEVIHDIVAGSLGLGQIVVKHKIPNQRDVIEIGRDRAGFWREYTITGPMLYIRIHERFQRKPFEDVGWLSPKKEGDK